MSWQALAEPTGASAFLKVRILDVSGPVLKDCFISISNNSRSLTRTRFPRVFHDVPLNCAVDGGYYVPTPELDTNDACSSARRSFRAPELLLFEEQQLTLRRSCIIEAVDSRHDT